MSIEQQNNKFLQGLKVDVNKLPQNVNSNRNIIPREKNTNLYYAKSSQNHQLHTIKNHPIYSSMKRYKGKVLNFMREHQKSIAAGLLAATLLSGGTAIGMNVYEAKRAEELSRNIEQEIEDRAMDKLPNTLENLSFDGQNFNLQMQCDRPELYKVLHNTDLDEILNAYFADPTDENKEKLMNDLRGREEEFAKFNVDLIYASLADSTNTSIDNITIQTYYKHYNEENGNEIMNGKAPYIGNTLRISNSEFTCEGYVDLPKHITNYSEIPEPLYKLITDTKLEYLTPDSSYFKMGKYPVEEDENSKLERSLKTYEEIKESINDGNFAIINGKFCVVSLEKLKKSQSEAINNKDNGQYLEEP